MNFYCSHVLLFLLIHKGLSQMNSTTFRAAVVEYHPPDIPIYILNPPDRVMYNVRAVGEIMANISRNAPLDVVVFPEKLITANSAQMILANPPSLDGYAVEIPDPKDSICPCCNPKKFPKFFVDFSCYAAKYKTYLLINFIERDPCTSKTPIFGCPLSGNYYYNTNVVFDRIGTVVAKYRKYHLFGEPLLDFPERPQISILKTDFGVTFGIFTCFDLLYRSPAIDIVKQHGIKHILYPSQWIDTPPLATSLQFQQGWAQEFDVVMLASGTNVPWEGSGGTGVYLGKHGPVLSGIVMPPASKAYVVDLPKTGIGMEVLKTNDDPTSIIDQNGKAMDGFNSIALFPLEYVTHPINLNQKHVQHVICSGSGKSKLCCHFTIDLTFDSSAAKKHYFHYRMAAYSGQQTFLYQLGGVQMCIITACLTEDRMTCSRRFENYNDASWPVTFNRIVVSANYTVDYDKLAQYPSTIRSDLRAIPIDSYNWTSQSYMNGTMIERTITLMKPQNRLFEFGILGRNFALDSNFAY